MKITRRQLRKIISEAIVTGPEGVHRVPPEDRSPRVPVGRLTKDRFHGTAPKSHHVSPEVAGIFDLDDPEQQEQAYELSDSMQDYMPGTAKAARDDLAYSKKTVRFQLSPLYEILKDVIPPGFDFHEAGSYVEETTSEFDPYGEGYTYTYDYVALHNAAGNREIEFQNETTFKTPVLMIRVYKIEPDEEFGFMRTMIDYAPVVNMNNVKDVKGKVDKLVKRMR